MRPALFAAAAAICLAASPPPASSGPATPGVTDLLYAEFLAALPHPEDWDPGTEPDPGSLARLGALNPGREAEVRSILSDQARCLAPALVPATRRMLRAVADRLGPDKVRTLIGFYRSDEFRRFDAIDMARRKQGSVTPAQEAALERFAQANPVAIEFAQAVQRSAAFAAEDQAFMREAQRCAALRSEALARAKLHF